MSEKIIKLKSWALIDTPHYKMDFTAFKTDIIYPDGRTISEDRDDYCSPPKWDPTPTEFLPFHPSNPRWKKAFLESDEK